MPINYVSGTGEYEVQNTASTDLVITNITVTITTGPISVPVQFTVDAFFGVYPITLPGLGAPTVIGVVESTPGGGLDLSSVASGSYFGDIIARLDVETDGNVCDYSQSIVLATIT